MTPPSRQLRLHSTHSEFKRGVIVAAYRVLANRYHPDRWKGDKRAANKKMVEINEAYGVLKDPVRRSEYDEARRGGTARVFDTQAEEELFEGLLSDLKDRWSVATGVFPDLEEIRSRLGRVSSRLAFAFAVLILETKRYKERFVIGESMEFVFLSTYFGKNPQIIGYSKTLIELGHREGLRTLNRLVDVMGDAVEPELIISRVQMAHDVPSFAAAIISRREKSEKILRVEVLKKNLRSDPYFDEAVELSKLLGYRVVEKAGFFSGEYTIYGPGDLLVFKTGEPARLVDYVVKNFATGQP